MALAVLAAGLCATGCKGFGSFDSEVPELAELRPGDALYPKRTKVHDRPWRRLANGFEYTDPEGTVWKAAEDTVTDGASIPGPLLFLFGGDRFEPLYLRASIVHDAYCGKENYHLDEWFSRSMVETHRMYYYGLRAGGTGNVTAKAMFFAVLLFGPKDPTPGSVESAMIDRAMDFGPPDPENLVVDIDALPDALVAALPPRDTESMQLDADSSAVSAVELVEAAAKALDERDQDLEQLEQWAAAIRPRLRAR